MPPPMISFLKNKDIDYAKWNACINSSYNELIYANSWYLDAVSPNWNAFVFGDYEAVMPITWKKKYEIKYVFPPFFTQQLGVFSRQELTSLQIKFFIDSLATKFKFIDLFLNSKNSIKDISHQVQLKPNYILPLNKSYNEITSNYNSNCKRNIKKAINNNLSIKTLSPGEVIDLYRLNYKHINTNCTQADYARFETLVKMHDQKGKADIIGAYHKNNLCTAGIFLRDNKRIYYLLGASNDFGKKTGSFHYLMNWIIQKYADTNLILDFEGSEIESIANFYMQFGSQKEDYFYLKINNLNWALKLFKK